MHVRVMLNSILIKYYRVIEYEIDKRIYKKYVKYECKMRYLKKTRRCIIIKKGSLQKFDNAKQLSDELPIVLQNSKTPIAIA